MNHASSTSTESYGNLLNLGFLIPLDYLLIGSSMSYIWFFLLELLVIIAGSGVGTDFGALRLLRSFGNFFSNISKNLCKWFSDQTSQGYSSKKLLITASILVTICFWITVIVSSFNFKRFIACKVK